MSLAFVRIGHIKGGMPLFQEHYRDKKLKQLYQTLTRSDFAGDFEDDYVLSVLYAMRCIDCHQSPSFKIPERHYVDLAKEIIRVYDTSEEADLDDLSIYAFTRALMAYMKENDLRYKDIHKMSTLRLLNELSVYFNKEVS